MKISTKTGDEMMTSAVKRRVYKDDPLIECLGTIDELQVSLMNASHPLKDPRIQKQLKLLVERLFLLGADLINEESQNIDSVRDLEEEINYYEKLLPEQKSFLLPGRTPEGCQIHMARVIARRLERRVVSYGRKVKLRPEIFAYLNRISDLLYIYARAVEEL
ncbi:MAG: cob(I)yrinic acid a,c-diamide adenosyltransferase [Bacilli bacterium]|nr:cob(I)yrinic acid a,c-diamide adenosyltransferase [Bacilli bacterium]